MVSFLNPKLYSLVHSVLLLCVPQLAYCLGTRIWIKQFLNTQHFYQCSCTGGLVVNTIEYEAVNLLMRNKTKQLIVVHIDDNIVRSN